LIAHMRVDIEESGIDYLAFSAHKIYAPFGCGVLIARKDLLKFSNTELEQIHASGEQNAAGIAALGKAFLLLKRIGMDNIREEEKALTGRALQGLSQIRGVRIFGIKESDTQAFDRKLGVIVFDMKGIMADRIARELTERFGIGVRYGCHCAHIIVKHILKVSPGLEKFQRLMLTLLPKVQLPGVTRVSLGIENTEEDVVKLIYALGKIGRLNMKESASKDYGPQNLSKADLKLQNKAFVSASAEKVYS
jgi:selenocysteine lyase/cysteine desulfurase